VRSQAGQVDGELHGRVAEPLRVNVTGGHKHVLARVAMDRHVVRERVEQAAAAHGAQGSGLVRAEVAEHGRGVAVVEAARLRAVLRPDLLRAQVWRGCRGVAGRRAGPGGHDARCDCRNVKHAVECGVIIWRARRRRRRHRLLRLALRLFLLLLLPLALAPGWLLLLLLLLLLPVLRMLAWLLQLLLARALRLRCLLVQWLLLLPRLHQLRLGAAQAAGTHDPTC
jgi:hypothetical protein